MDTQSLTVLTGDCRQLLKTLPIGSVHCCVTSPPYWGLRDYAHPDQIGQESTPDQYVEVMHLVFAEVRRVLRNDGTLWLNLSDSYYGSWGNYAASGNAKARKKPRSNRYGTFRPPTAHGTSLNGLKAKDLCGIPWRVALALQADGWYLRSDIIWHKPNVMPESVTDRPTKAHEYLFLLSKSKRYYYDAVAIKDPASPESAMRLLRGVSSAHKYVDGRAGVLPPFVRHSGRDSIPVSIKLYDHAVTN
ncbi:MAG TPA: site-specific DNA-methyltransferase [Verrucomicrobiae bacterium]